MPAWISSGLRVQDGRDPLGLQTTTQDRLTPVLLPGILELSNRARYFSFHLFLLAEYRRRKLSADRRAFSNFVRRREYEYGLAVLMCERCDSSPVGAQRVRPAVATSPSMFERGESVKSDNGGYGLYYRSPLITFGAVWPAGTEFGSEGETLPIDVIRDHDVVEGVARAFGEAVSDTAYAQQYFLTDDPIPSAVIAEYASVACLCRLDQHPDERDALRRLLLTALDPSMDEEVLWRRRAAAHYLHLMDQDSAVVEDEQRFRQMLWRPPSIRSAAHAAVADRWAALAAKDAVQDALCSIWTDFIEHGRHRAGWDPLGPGELRDVVSGLCHDEALGLRPDLPLRDVIRSEDDVEKLREWTADEDSAGSGLLAFDATMRAIADRSSADWVVAASIGSAWQPSLIQMRARWDALLAGDPTASEAMWWLIRHHVISVHERIAYSKLPEFTFRFRSESTGLRFFDLSPGRFILAAIRHRPLGTLTADLGYWSGDESPALTGDGSAFVAEVLA